MTTLPELIEQSLDRKAMPETVRLEIDLPDRLPMVSIDRTQIGKVLRNLVFNALQAMPNGGVLRIAARPVSNPFPTGENDKASGEQLELIVEDSGEGIAPENMDKMFQPLFTTKSRGSGLGLVTCKNLVEANGGRIEVQSEFGAGTTFTVILPTERG